MNELNFVYTNLADSVIYAGFSGHQYTIAMRGNSEKYEQQIVPRVYEVYQEKLDSLLEMIKTSNDTGLVFTLNQICDNRYLNLERQQYHFDILKELLQQGKLKISRFNNHDLISYTLNAMEQCVRRLCGGETTPDMVYVSSLFYELGVDNTDTAARGRLTFLLGYANDKIRYDETEKIFFLKNGKSCRLDDLVKKSYDKEAYGVYTLFRKYVQSGGTFPITDNTLYYVTHLQNLRINTESSVIVNWIRNIYELNEVAKACGGFIENVRSGIKLNDIMKLLLQDDSPLLNEKIDFWLGQTKERSAVKQGIRTILKGLTETCTNRTAMYIETRAAMHRYAETVIDDDVLYSKFETHGSHEKRKSPQLRTKFVILNIIDFAYNLLNMLFASESSTIIESFAALHSVGQVNSSKGLMKLHKVQYAPDTLRILQTEEV